MRVAITSQNLDPRIVVSGISTVADTIIRLTQNQIFLFEMGYRDQDSKKRGIRWVWKQLKFVFTFPYFLITNRIEIVHLNVPFNTMGIIREYAALCIAKLLRKKVLVHIHGGKYLMIPCENPAIKFFIKSLLNQGDKVLVLSELEKDILNKNYSFDSAEFLLNAVDTSLYEFKPFNELRTDKVTVLYLARITESKGIDDVVEAFKKLYPILPFKLIVCGTGPSQVEFVAACEKLMNEDFEYRGVVSGKDKLSAIYSSDLFILPSRHSEGLPMSLLETMAAGLVPIVTDEASMKYVVEHEKNGIQVNKYDGEDIFIKMKQLIENRTKIKELSFAARKTIVEKYDSKKYVNSVDRLYNLISKTYD